MANYIRGNVDEDLSLGTLASKTQINSVLQAVDGQCRITSIKAIWALHGFTVGDNAGPIMVGIAHGDYSDSEIEAWIESGTQSWSRGKLAEQEVDNRLIRRVGIFTPVVSLGAEVLNEGRSIRTKLNWALMTGQSIRLWAYNMGSAALGTTDPNMHVQGKVNLFFK